MGGGRGAAGAVLHPCGRRARDQQRHVPDSLRFESILRQIQSSSERCAFLLCSGKASNFHRCSSGHKCNDRVFVDTALKTVEARSCSSSTMGPCSVLALRRRGRRFAFRLEVGAHHTGDGLMSISLRDCRCMHMLMWTYTRILHLPKQQ